MPTTLSGYGTLPYGTGSFGTGIAVPTLAQAFAVRENVLRLVFSEPPRYTRLLDPNDASDPRRYSIAAVSGTFGRDEEPTRAVAPIVVEVVDDEGLILDLILDRPMSPDPSEYDVTIAGLVSALSLSPFLSTTVRYFGLFKGIKPLVPELVVNNRDIANPQSYIGVYGTGLPIAEGQNPDALLGGFVADATGDLAYDEGLVGYTKRVYRRLTTRRKGFSHLQNYGVSTLASVKQLARAGVREFLADEAESQIRQEPETVDVSVDLVVDPAHPELGRYRIRAQARFGRVPVFTVPVLQG